MASPIQSGDDEYDFLPGVDPEEKEAKGNTLLILCLTLYAIFFIFLVVIVFLVYRLWCAGRCCSKCDVESGGNTSHSDKLTKDDDICGQVDVIKIFNEK